ncbi:MAG TPA: hypothetical protein VFZ25_06045, partial [Chloroflexota bacterium]|nr:hypothetical protein [Chloroflexota bacterium]
DDGFGGTSIPLAITYNAKNQTATQTGCTTTTVPAGGCGTVWSMSYTGPGQSERVSQSSSAGSASYQYSQLGIGKEQDSITDPNGASFVRDPYGTLVAMRVGDPASYYYLFDGDGSVIKLVGSAGNVVASYLYCPTGNLAEPGSGQFEFTNPYRKYGAFYDWRYLTYWLNGLQIDANSGNARQLSPLQGGYADLNSLPYSLLRSAESVALAAGADAFGIDLALSVGAGPDATVGLDIVYDFASHEEGVFAMAGGGFGLGELGSASALVVFNLSSVADFSGPFVNFSAGAEAGAGVAITAFTTFPGTGSVYGFAFAPAGEGAVVSGTITSDVLLRETYWPGPGTL